MKLHLPPDIAAQFIAALRKAGRLEIGGVLMGEHTGPDTFRIERITIQYRSGTFASFVRLVEEIIGPLREYFAYRRHDYRRFNYLGEWHSHHSFELEPSRPDLVTMFELINDPALGANFAVLLLVRLDAEQLSTGLTVYRPGHEPYDGVIISQHVQEKIPQA